MTTFRRKRELCELKETLVKLNEVLVIMVLCSWTTILLGSNWTVVGATTDAHSCSPWPLSARKVACNSSPIWECKRTVSADHAQLLSFRGGDDDDEMDTSSSNGEDNSEEEVASLPSEVEEDGESISSQHIPFVSAADTQSRFFQRQKRRRASEIIMDLMTRSSIDDEPESQKLRELIMERTLWHLEDAQRSIDTEHDPKNGDDGDEALRRVRQHPRKLLHFLAPKVPAIRHAPDAALRIQASPSDMDAGVAACILSSLGYLCAKLQCPTDDLVIDRRLEQLAECVLCSLDINKAKQEHEDMPRQPPELSLLNEGDSLDTSGDTDASGELMIDQEDLDDRIAVGLGVRDCCRAAWGLAMLGAHQCESLGGETVPDVFMALSLRARDLLLIRLKTLRQGDLFDEADDANRLTIDERLEDFSEEIAEDAASAMWAFACVQACVENMRFDSLVDVCSSILCRRPFQLRRQAQEMDLQSADDENIQLIVGANDIVDRLVESEVRATVVLGEHDEPIQSDVMPTKSPDSRTTFDSISLVEYLSPYELIDVVWALALYGTRQSSSTRWTKVQLSKNVAQLQLLAFSWLADWLRSRVEQRRDVGSERHIGRDAKDTSVDEAPLVGEDDSPRNDVATDDTPPALSNVFDDESEMRAGSADTQVLDKEAAVAGFFANESQARHILCCPQDLCSIAWTAAALHPNNASTIVSLVASNILAIDADSARSLTGGEIANLAWAMARCANARDDREQLSFESAALVMEWVARVISNDAETAQAEGKRFKLIPKLQPAELGRLLWSMAFVFGDFDHTAGTPVNVSTLAAESLSVAIHQLNSFGANDLTAIAWAFLALSGNTGNGLVSRNFHLHALGHVSAVIDGCLVRWESGKLNSTYLESTKGEARVPNRFGSFWSRQHAHHNVWDHHEDSSETDISQSAEEKVHMLPLLRDLPIEPSTLCKAACAFSNLDATVPGLVLSGTITRVAMQLLSSQKGRVLRECSVDDVTRLCEAAALSLKTSNPGISMISRFCRTLLQVLHELPALDGSSNLRYGDTIRLIWSLSELGIKYEWGEMKPSTQRPALTTTISMRDLGNLQSLTNGQLLKLLAGFVNIGAISNNQEYANLLLLEVKRRLPTLAASSYLCDLFESSCSLHSSVLSTYRRNQQNISEATTISTVSDSFGTYFDLLKLCEQVGGMIAESIIESLPIFAPADLRRIVMSCSRHPLGYEKLLKATAAEIDSRVAHLDQLSDGQVTHIEDGLARAESSITKLRSHLIGSEEEEVPSIVPTIGRRILSLFQPRPPSSTGSNPGDVLPADNEGLSIEAVELVLHHLEEAWSAIQLVQSQVEQTTWSSRTSLDGSMRQLEQAARLELGRCQGWLASFPGLSAATSFCLPYGDQRRDSLKTTWRSRLVP